MHISQIVLANEASFNIHQVITFLIFFITIVAEIAWKTLCRFLPKCNCFIIQTLEQCSNSTQLEILVLKSQPNACLGTPQREAQHLGGCEVRLKEQAYIFSLLLLFLGLIFTFFLRFFPCGQKGELCLYDKCVFWGTTMIREHIFTLFFLGGC